MTKMDFVWLNEKTVCYTNYLLIMAFYSVILIGITFSIYWAIRAPASRSLSFFLLGLCLCLAFLFFTFFFFSLNKVLSISIRIYFISWYVTISGTFIRTVSENITWSPCLSRNWLYVFLLCSARLLYFNFSSKCRLFQCLSLVLFRTIQS